MCNRHLKLQACLVCLNTQGVLYKIDSGHLKTWYCLASGIKDAEIKDMPQYLCIECTALVKRFKSFREKCKRGHFTLKQLLKSKKKQVTTLTLEALNRDHLQITPSLSYLKLDRVYYETAIFKWDKHNRLGIQTENDIPVFQCSTLDLENKFESNNAMYNHIKEEIDESEVPVTNNDEALDINNDFFDNYDDDDDDEWVNGYDGNVKVEEDNADGNNLEEEYASIEPISIKEAEAAVEVYKLFSSGKFLCDVCNKKFFSEKRLTAHLRMHDEEKSGSRRCDLCKTFYKTDFLLKTHITDKHMFKYICRKCPEVNFDRSSAKQHYIWSHLQKGDKKGTSWYESRPSWMLTKGKVARQNRVATLRPVRKLTKLPKDFPVYSPVSQEEQYKLVEDRKKSRNYIEALFRCEKCYRGFRENATYSKHMKKHDPSFSGPLQCDMCKLHFRDARRVYKHMIISHLFKYSCQLCSFVSPNRSQAKNHYRWHKNFTYKCSHCDKEFKKASTRLTHIRIKHPSTNICNMCGHSFVGENGLYCHKRIAHTPEEIERANAMNIDLKNENFCKDCSMQFVSDEAFATHLGSSNKHATTNLSIKPSQRFPKRTAGDRTERRSRTVRPRAASDIVNNGLPTPTNCELCGFVLANDVEAKRHYQAEHPGADLLKRYMCDQCGHTTRQYANLVVHMRTHTQEKPYTCPHCERRFSMPGNRDRHLVVHTGEKKYQCQHCSRRFTQSSAVKLHIQTVHMKIPYAPWDKKSRKRRKELEKMNATVLPLSISAAPSCAQPLAQPTLVLDAQAHYNAYISFND